MPSSHLVVDGSNIATEGRSLPSLSQLDEAVRALLAEQPYERVTVVVDATFGHRIDARERKVFEEAVANGEVVSPPAGAIGRGDAFVLSIAERANADVLSNDSFQEFHGTYEWLFDEGRLIGGKPVPDVGWVFVLRTPVRGPTSRRSVREARTPRSRGTKAAHPAEAGADDADAIEAAATTADRAPPVKRSRRSVAPTGPMPVPTSPPPRPAASTATERPLVRARAERAPAEERGAPRTALNEGPAYMNFVIDHPLGSVIDAVVDRFSSHGAYVTVGAAHCYLPLKALGDPPPRSAREVFKLGETRSFIVQRFDPARRGIDLVPVDVAPRTDSGEDAAEAVAPATETPVPIAEEAPVSPAAKKAPAKKAPARKAPARKAPARKAITTSAPVRKAATKAATGARSVAKKATAATRTVARKVAGSGAAATAKKAPAAKRTAAKTPAKRATAVRSTTVKAVATKAPAAKKVVAKKTAPKTAAKTAPKTAPKTAAKTATKTAPKTAAKTATKRAPARKASPTKAAAKKR